MGKCPICLMSWCGCWSGMLGLLLHKTGVATYWIAAPVSWFCPCCLYTYARSCTDMYAQLGGEKDDIVSGCFSSFCCAPCSIARDVEALDAVTNQTLGCFSVSSSDART